MTVVDSFGNIPGTPAIVEYDPVARVVTVSNPTPGAPWLTVGQLYRIEFPVSAPDATTFGLRAIDGATIDPATPSIVFSVVAPSGTPFAEPAIDFCSDVFPLFAAARPSAPAMHGVCSTAGCHGTASPAHGLVLETEHGIRTTAIGALAVETSTAALGTPLPPQPAFPTGMPLIDPGNPSDSYLIYKLLLPDENGVPSARGTSVPYTACKPVTPPFDYGPMASLASADEAARLSAHVFPRRMPWGDYQPATQTFTQGGGTPLTFDELERIRLWIQQGAKVDDCSACPATSP